MPGSCAAAAAPRLLLRHRRIGGVSQPFSGIMKRMKVWLEVPDALAEQLAGEGQNLSRAALEALAVDAYRVQRLTGVELCRLLDIPSRSDLDAFLKRHGVPLEYTIEEFEREGATSARLWDKARAELGQS